jgi:hypothetical protein
MEVLLFLFFLHAFLVYYLFILVPLLVGAVLLRRGRKRVGWIFIAASLLPVIYYSVKSMDAAAVPEKRAAEIRSWPRTAIEHAQPQVLVVRDGFDGPRPYVYFLAETGQFDVYAVQGRDGEAVRHLQVERSDECRNTRTKYTEMVVLTGWRACAVGVPVESAPEEGLVLYTDRRAPHSWGNTGHDATAIRGGWTLELTVRQGANERLVAYDEALTFAVLDFNLLTGPFDAERHPPRRRTPGGDMTTDLEPAAFVLESLHIDKYAIVPPFASSREERRELVDRLTATGQPDDTHLALDIIAAADVDAGLHATLVRMAASPVMSAQMRVPYQDRWCEKVNRVLRYRDALIEGCSKSAQPLNSRCAELGDSTYWLQQCAPDIVPIWRGKDETVRRVYIANAGASEETSIALRQRARLTEFRVPADRGPIDLVIRAQGSGLFQLTGAVSCIVRLTVIEGTWQGAASGVIGINPGRVRFAYPVLMDMDTILGAQPEVRLVEPPAPIDLGVLLKPLKAPLPCPPDNARTEASPFGRADGTATLKASNVLTAPPLVPRDLP